jgi:hypothetical protein
VEVGGLEVGEADGAVEAADLVGVMADPGVEGAAEEGGEGGDAAAGADGGVGGGRRLVEGGAEFPVGLGEGFAVGGAEAMEGGDAVAEDTAVDGCGDVGFGEGDLFAAVAVGEDAGVGGGGAGEGVEDDGVEGDGEAEGLLAVLEAGEGVGDVGFEEGPAGVGAGLFEDGEDGVPDLGPGGGGEAGGGVEVGGGHGERGVSAVAPGEVAEEIAEGVDGRLGDGVVEGSADGGGEGAVALEAVEAGVLGLEEEGGEEVGVMEVEDDVHDGAVVGVGAGQVEAGGSVEGVVEGAGLGLVDGVHGGEAADVVVEPAEDEEGDVDGEDGGCVVDAAGLGMAAVVEHGGEVGRGGLEEIVTDEDEGDAGGAEVFLGVGVDEGEAGGVDRGGEEVGGHVAEAGDVVAAGGMVELDALDGFVGDVVEVGGVWGGGEVGGVGEGAEPVGFTGPGDADGSFAEGFGDGFAAPVAGVEVIGGGWLAAEEGDGDLAELEGAAALEEEDVEGGVEAEEGAEELFGFVEDVAEPGGAMADAEDGESGFGDFAEGLLGGEEDGVGECAGAGGEVVGWGGAGHAGQGGFGLGALRGG